MAGANESRDRDASINTQMPFDTQLPFGTQSPHPPRSRSDTDEVAFVGINRMEPVLAGSTQRAELKPRSGSSDVARQQARLLSLINKAPPPAPPPAPPQSQSRHVPTAPSALNEHSVMHPARSSETLIKQTNRERFEDSYAGATQTPTEKGKKRIREVEIDSPSTHHSAKKTSFSEDDSRHSRASEMDKFAAECSWMKGLKLNHASATVPEDQALLLQKPESWYKAEPGQRAVNEVPAHILMVLSRMADEAAALEGATSSGSYHETNPSSSSHPVNSAPQLIDEESTESEDEAQTSPVSWQTSPSPEPPQRPTFSLLGLPPDSSLELPQDGVVAVESQSSKRHNRSQDQSLPASSHEHETGLRPSSPLARQAATDSDEDMELETSVPQALGEDLLSQPVGPGQLPTAESRPTPVVQVAETPYVKGKNAQQPVVTVSPPTQSSNAQSENSSSVSIVRGTYQDPSSSAIVEETRLDVFQENNGEDVQRTAVTVGLTRSPEARVPQEAVQDRNPLQAEPAPMSAQLPPKDSSSGEQAALAPNKDVHTMPPQPGIEAMQRTCATPSLNKRKRSPTTPPQGFRQGRKRTRHLKKVLFMRKDGEDRQQSTTSAESRQGSVSDHSVQQVADTKVEDLDVGMPTQPQATENILVVEPEMSPRHQSLYAPPSPVLRPTTKPAVPSVPSSAGVAQTKQAVPEATVTRQSATETIITTQPSNIQPPTKSSSVPPQAPQVAPASAPAPVPVHASVPEPQQPESKASIRTEHVAPAAAVDVLVSTSVSDMFKAAYPEYRGTVKHFSNQCKLIERLDREDKMVSKSMWDDFIIRNQTDYKPYVSDCIDAGEEPMSYIRFYKDTIDHPIYTKKVVATRAVLLKALQELGVQPIAAEASPLQPPIWQDLQHTSHQSPSPLMQQPKYARLSYQPPQQRPYSPLSPPTQSLKTPPKKKRPRTSLPFSRPSTSTPARADATAFVRHSLDAGSSRVAPTPTSSSSTAAQPAASPRSRFASAFGDTLRGYKKDISSSSIDSSPGLEFRDFVKAQQKLTSATGSRRVSSTPAPTPGIVKDMRADREQETKTT